MKFKKSIRRVTAMILIALLLCPFPSSQASGGPDQTKTDGKNVLAQYQEYKKRLDSITYETDIPNSGFKIVETQIFPIEIAGYGEVSMIPAFDSAYSRLALFFTDETGKVIYRTDQLETNNRITGQMKQPTKSIAAVSFQDVNKDGRMDIILITSCVNNVGAYAGKPYKIGDVLFQSKPQAGFYRDYRISDKINRFGMNKGAELITAFVRDGCSTEFLYTAATLKELEKNGLQIITEQCYSRVFGKLGRLQVVPGTYHISNFDIFMVYLVGEQGDIISSLQPMGDYDNLYGLKGINCRDIDGDGLKDIVILAGYSYDDENGQLILESDYSIYYQRTGGFSADTTMKDKYKCSDNDTMDSLVEKARAYWGWKSEE